MRSIGVIMHVNIVKSIINKMMSRRDNLILVPNKLEQIQKLNESFEDGVLIIFINKCVSMFYKL